MPTLQREGANRYRGLMRKSKRSVPSTPESTRTLTAKELATVSGGRLDGPPAGGSGSGGGTGGGWG
jgi:bacteriocin-like protein